MWVNKLKVLHLAAALIVASGLLQAQNGGKEPGQFDASQRLSWFTRSSFGPGAQFSSVAMAGLNTWRDIPSDYGPGWDGFGKRYGVRMADRAVSNGLEAGFGSFWGEDPRYFRTPDKPLGGRLWNTVKMTVVTHNSSGQEMPAYARFIAVPGTAFLSNTWRPDSENKTNDALGRIATAYGTRVLHNVMAEFWPDVKQRMFHRNRRDPADIDIPGDIR
jgi:hypothetical protein